MLPLLTLYRRYGALVLVSNMPFQRLLGFLSVIFVVGEKKVKPSTKKQLLEDREPVRGYVLHVLIDARIGGQKS